MTDTPTLFDQADRIEAEWFAHPRPSHYERPAVTVNGLPYVPHSPTSAAAASSAKLSAPNQRERVLSHIRANPGVTDEAGANALGMNPSTYRPRRIELANGGQIRPCGHAKTASGRNAVTWEVV